MVSAPGGSAVGVGKVELTNTTPLQGTIGASTVLMYSLCADTSTRILGETARMQPSWTLARCGGRSFNVRVYNIYAIRVHTYICNVE